MKTKLAAVFTLIFTLLLCSACFFPVLPFGGNGEFSTTPQKFSKGGITLTLTESFKEEESERGFYAYYTSSRGGVMVLKEAFTLDAGLESKTLEEYLASVIANNGHTDVTPVVKDELIYYTKDETMLGKAVRYFSFAYKGTDSFWIVQFGCYVSEISEMEPLIMGWAKSVTVA